MIRTVMFFLALATPLAAQAPPPAAEGPSPAGQTPPHAGGRQPGQPGAPDAGPAIQPPRTEGPQAINRGTDGAAIGQQQPGATGITPQGMMGTATAGARDPQAPVGGHPPQSASPAEDPVVAPTPAPAPSR